MQPQFLTWTTTTTMHIIKTAYKKYITNKKEKCFGFLGTVSFDGEADHDPAPFPATLMETFGKHKRYCSRHCRTALFIIYQGLYFSCKNKKASALSCFEGLIRTSQKSVSSLHIHTGVDLLLLTFFQYLISVFVLAQKKKNTNCFWYIWICCCRYCHRFSTFGTTWSAPAVILII